MRYVRCVRTEELHTALVNAMGGNDEQKDKAAAMLPESILGELSMLAYGPSNTDPIQFLDAGGPELSCYGLIDAEAYTRNVLVTITDHGRDLLERRRKMGSKAKQTDEPVERITVAARVDTYQCMRFNGVYPRPLALWLSKIGWAITSFDSNRSITIESNDSLARPVVVTKGEWIVSDGHGSVFSIEDEVLKSEYDAITEVEKETRAESAACGGALT